MPQALDTIRLGRIPGQRVGPTTRLTADSSDVGAGATLQIASVTVPVEAGHTYCVKLHTGIRASSGGDSAEVFLREDSSGGTTLQDRAVSLTTSTGTTGYGLPLEADFDATVDGDKTFVAILRGFAGNVGDVTMEASGIAPTLFYVEYVEETP